MTDHAPLLENVFRLDYQEASYPIEGIRGQVPDYVRGTYYVNGPARFVNADLRYNHWLDADGMVCSLAFGDDGVRFTNRFVRSTKFAEEREAGRALYRTFGTAFEGDRLLHGIGLMSPVNVSVYPAFGKLLAFGEQGLPWELDPATLETRGEHNFGGKLNPVSPFSAHPNVDYDTGEMFNFGVSFSARQPCINLYRFSAAGEMVYRRRLPIDHACSLHDFGISPSYAVFHLSPYRLSMEELMAGGTLMDSLRWEPERGSRLIVARRDDGQQVASVELPGTYSLHQINCFERHERLVVDLVELDRPVYDQYTVPDLFREVRLSQPVRTEIDVEGGRAVERHTLSYREMCDFPAVDPRRATRTYDDFWVLGISASEHPGRKFFDRLVHLRWSDDSATVYQAPPGCYLGGEPIFLGDPADDRRGAVICQQFEAATRRSWFLIFDAHDVAAGPLAELPLRYPVHLGFHASFDSAS